MAGSETVKILGIPGSYGLESKNGMLVKLALRAAAEMGADTEIWDLTTDPLPLVGEEGCWNNEIAKKFQALASECDGFIISSPEYHGCMSGVMKNCLDWVYKDHVGGKPFALLSTLGGIENSNTLNQMRIAVRWLHGWAIPEQMAVGNVKEAFDEEGNLVSTESRERLSGVVSSLVSTARMLKRE